MTTTFRIRLLAAALVLVGLAFVQDPGFLVADTKVDLAVAPGEFLSRALHLWDGEGAFGQLQNQAYGYVWPMGPFFGLGSLLGLPGWVVQRLWIALVMVVALWGAARLARALGVRSDLACLVAGVAFALSPRMLTTLGPISIEAWPSALAPWVLLPLVLGSRAGSPRRAAAWSAAAIAMVGGVNAAATFAVIPLGALWLLTRTPGPRRRRLMLWWPAFTLLATAWWLVPLFVLGAYSPPFLDFIETAAVTTFPTTPFDVLRGTSNWVPYISTDARAGKDLLTTSFLVLDGGVVLALGLAGLLDRRTPHRGFLGWGVLVGVLMVGAGHVGATSGWFAGDVRVLLDGALAPLRNVHKFDVVLRLPLVLGLAFLVDRVLTRPPPAVQPPDPVPPAVARLQRVNRVAVVGMVLLVVAGTVVPVLQGRIPPRGATVGVPDYWTQAADWLGEAPRDGTDLLVPGSSFADYVWGQPQDEPLQWLARSPWAVRNVVPLAAPGNIRMLDEIEGALAEGAGSRGLLVALQRAGVRHLVVRNDLAASSDVPDPVLVHAAIAQTPGLVRAASFGPLVGGETRLETADGDPLLINGGWQAFHAAIEVYAVPAAPAAVVSGAPAVVVGGPEDLGDLGDLGVLDDAPTVLAADVAGGTGASGEAEQPSPRDDLVLTDGLRTRERAFGRLHDATSAVTTPGDRRRTTGPATDYPVGTGSPAWRTTARLEGARALSASSSASDAVAVGGSRRGELPYAAVDGDAATQWVSAPFGSGQSWWRIDLDEALDPGGTVQVELVGGEDAPPDQLVRVRTAGGATAPVPLGPGEGASVVLASGRTTWLRVEDASGIDGRPVALADVDLPGLDVRRRLVLPTPPAAWGTPDRIVLRRDADARKGCVEVPTPTGTDVRCVAGRDRADEEPVALRRAFSLPAARTYRSSVTLTPRAGRELDRVVLGDQPVDVVASSVAVPDPRASPVAAVDGDPGTTWLADPEDDEPTLRLSWIGQRRVSRIELDVDQDAAARTPTRVRITTPRATRTVRLVDGVATFRALRSDRMTLRVLDDDGATSLGFDSMSIPVPVGVSEVRLDGVEYLPLGLSADVRRYPCGSGPRVDVDGRSVRTRIVAAPAELARGRTVAARLCGGARPVGLDRGEHTLDVESTPAFALDTLVLGGDRAVGGATTPVTAMAGAATRTVEDDGADPAEGGDLVVLRQNVNPGWVAEQDGEELAPVVVDGWQQGWRLADGAGPAPVEATFAPDGTYRVGLLAGLLVAAGFLAALVPVPWRGRRRRSPTRAGAEPPLLDRDPTTLTAAAASVAAAGLLAGTPAAVIAAVTVAAVVVLGVARSTRGPGPGLSGVLAALAPAAPYVLAAPVLLATAAYAVRPWGSVAGWAGDLAWPAYLLVVPLAALLVVGARRPGRRGRRGTASRRRSAGRSTSR